MATTASSSVFRRTTAASSNSPLFTLHPSFKLTPPLLYHLYHRRNSISTAVTPRRCSRSPISQTLDHQCSSSSGELLTFYVFLFTQVAKEIVLILGVIGAEDGETDPKDEQKIILKGMRYNELEVCTSLSLL